MGGSGGGCTALLGGSGGDPTGEGALFVCRTQQFHVGVAPGAGGLSAGKKVKINTLLL